MIHSFSYKNFYSFRDVSDVSFVVNKKAPIADSYTTTSSGFRLSKILTVLGPNASGKTNLLKALSFLKYMMIASFNLDPESKIPLKPFLFDNSKNKLSSFSIDFEIKNSLYRYEIDLTEEKILHEQLRVKGSTKFITIFKRNWDEKSSSYHFEDKKLKTFSFKGFEKSIRKNASIISTGVRFNSSISKEISDYFKKIETNVREQGKFVNLPEVLNIFYENKFLKKEADRLLSKFDLGLSGITIDRKDNENEKGKYYSYRVMGMHKIGDNTLSLPFHYESIGTQRLLSLLKYILTVLNKGGIAVLDEFDTDLHPGMLESLLDLFISKETNPLSAQIIFTSHSPLVLNFLDKYQVILVEKNNNGFSESWRLDEMTGVRPDDNFYSKYIAGAYGAIPNL